MRPSTTLTMVGDTKIVVPDSLNLITPYVLREQQDWFEDEIKFLRRLLRPGQKVIDIGANYGVYTLSLAKIVGSAGTVWAYEPAAETAKMLTMGIAANDFTQVILDQSAISSACGSAQLQLNENTELNALFNGTLPNDIASETVSLVSLDVCLERKDWKNIDFVKIDAEGAESQIIQGGKRFFSELSPLVQYEIKAGETLNLSLLQEFEALGYTSYRLVPGLELLIPFDPELIPDAYLLNLFCCKLDRAQLLAADGLLLESLKNPSSTENNPPDGVLGKLKDSNQYGWRQTLAKLPYGAQLTETWESTMTVGESLQVDQALSLFAMSRDASLPPRDRFQALEASFFLLKDCCLSGPLRLRLASFARVARDYGARQAAVMALDQLAGKILEQNRVDMREPFLAPSERFEPIPPTDRVGNWVLAAVLEEMELLCAYSSFFTGASSLQRLELIEQLGFGSEEMKRRLQLVRMRFKTDLCR